jgi:hypothetical protein
MTASIKTFLKTYFAVGMALSLLAIYQTEQQTQAFLKIRSRYKWVVVMALFALNVVGGVYLLWRPPGSSSFWQKFELDPSRIGWKMGGLLLVAAGFPLLWIAKYDFFGKAVPDLFPLLWVWWWLVLIQAVGLKMLTGASWALAFLSALLLDGIVFQSYVILQAVSDYPFSLGWSEASRFYYGSLPFSYSIYGVSLPLSIWHATRYFLLAVPFLIHGLPLWADRLWQALLWLVLSGLTSWSFVRRLGLGERGTKIFLRAWLFLYLFQGAVYYHLQICIILILLGVSARHPLRSLVAVLLASFWAGMSRLNWYPVPAMLAITVYLLEEPFARSQNIWSYVAKPALWGALGLITALAGQAFYIFISGNRDWSAFESSLHSPLLFYRWFPNDTNPLGILPAILLVSLPLLVILFWTLRGNLTKLHPLRKLGILAILLVLFVGGLVVSSKIGGGGDLHNMDAFMVMLALVAGYVLAGKARTDGEVMSPFEAVPWPMLVLMLIIPVTFSFSRIAPPIQYDHVQSTGDLSTLSQSVQSYSSSGPVLFIYERHLLTFGMIPRIPIVQDYEVVTLMEMAISNNQPYLNRFYKDLQSHRFAAIVATKQNLDSQSVDFAEESAVWNRLVAYPLLCEYVPTLTLQSSNVEVFIPRSARQCPTIASSSGQP